MCSFFTLLSKHPFEKYYGAKSSGNASRCLSHPFGTSPTDKATIPPTIAHVVSQSPDAATVVHNASS